MNKLEYDNLHKFYVSIGVACIILPFVILFFLLKGEVQIISAEEYSHLSRYSYEMLAFRERILNFINNKYVISVLIIILFLLIITGVFLLIKGLKGWTKTQKEYDTILKMNRIEQELNIKKLNATEILEKTVNEVNEDNHPKSNNNHNIQESLSRYMFLESAYLERCLPASFKKQHFIERNVRVDHNEFDAIAIDKNGFIDSIFEIKCNTVPLPSEHLKCLIQRLLENAEQYAKKRNRIVKCVLVFISNEKTINYTKIQIEGLANQSDFHNMFQNLQIQYIDENELINKDN